MQHFGRITLLAVGVLGIAAMLFSACGKDNTSRPFVPPEDPYDSLNEDTTGIRITDSILVYFGDEMWKTLDYTSYIDTEYSYTGTMSEWINLEIHYPGKRYPYIKLVFYNELGNNTSNMTINNPGIGYTVPGLMARGLKGGDLYYYRQREMLQPDGTYTSDWRPLVLTTSILELSDYFNSATARIDACMFDFGQWMDSSRTGHPINVDDADKTNLVITFGRLRIAD